MSKLTLRLGIMCDNPAAFQEWQAQCLKHLLELETVEIKIALLIINAAPLLEPAKPATRSLKAYLPNGRALWTRYFERQIARRSRARWPNNLTATLLADVPRLSCQTQARQKFEHFRPEDLETIRSYNLDFILKFGFGSLDGEILEAARYGVWAFSHRPPGQYPAGPVGFWEIYQNEEVSGAVLQRLMPQGGSRTLYKGFFPMVRHSYRHNLDTIYLESVKWPGYVCRDIARGKAAYLDSETVETVPVSYKIPHNWQTLLFRLKLLRNRVINSGEKLFRHEQWNVGVVNQRIENFLKPNFQPQINWLPTPDRNCFVADPFIYEKDNELPVLVVEGFDYRTYKGWIAALKKQMDGSFGQAEKALELPSVHLSFPYPVKYQGEIYCMPETHQANEVALYKAASYPTGWEKFRILLEDFRGLDPSVFEYEGRWWLLCTEQDGGISENARLYGWYASDLFGPWTAHPANPLKTDVRSSRPAGTLFWHEGQLYRPAQDYSRTYGGAVTINRIVRLTPEEFCEEAVTQVKPYADSPYKVGLHTLSSAGDFTVLDAKRNLFVWAAFKREIKRIIGRRLKR